MTFCILAETAATFSAMTLHAVWFVGGGHESGLLLVEVALAQVAVPAKQGFVLHHALHDLADKQLVAGLSMPRGSATFL